MNVEHLKYLCSPIPVVARCTCEIKSRNITARASLNSKTPLFTSTLDLNLRKKLVKCYFWSIAFSGAEIWTLRKAVQKYLERSQIWCWRRMEKITWIDRVKNEEVLKNGERKEHPIYNKTKVVQLDWSNLALKLPSTTRF